MAGFTTGFSQTVLDTMFASGDYFAWSVNGSSEFAGLARTAVGSWAAATAADPSVKANAGALSSAPCTSTGTISHFAVFTASTAGTQKTDWIALGTPRALGVVGDQLTIAAGAIGVTLT